MPGPTRASKANNENNKKRRARSSKKAAGAPHADDSDKLIYDLEAIAEARDAGKRQYGLAENTSTNYSAAVKRAKIWLAELVKTRRAALASGKAGVNPFWNGMELEDLEKAFDEQGPNKTSPFALEHLLTVRCLIEAKSKSTGDVIYSAMKNYWANM